MNDSMDPELWRQRFAQDPQTLAFSAHTRERYHYEIPRFLRFLQRRGLTTLAALTREDLQQYWLEVYYSKTRKGKTPTPGSLGVRLSVVVGFVRFLVRQDYLLLDVSAGMALPKRGKVLPRNVLSEEETLRLLHGPNVDKVLGLRDRAILEMLYGTAVRNSELRFLKLADLDWPRHLVRVVAGKGNKDRWMPLGEEAEIWLEEYLQKSRPALVGAHSGETVFLSRTGRLLRCQDLAALVSRCARQVGLEKHITPHCLRHSCATHMLHRGAGLRQLQTMLGHENINTTQLYTRVEPSELRKTLVRYHPRESRP